MADASLPTGPIQIIGTADCVARPGSVRLDDYPLLTFAPEQYGKGIRTEDNGTTVAAIAEAFALNPNIYAIATQFATSVNHVADAIKYSIKIGLAQATTST
jgi:hypothetical protein